MIPEDEKLRRFLAVSAIGYGLAGLNMLLRRTGFEADLKRIDRKRTPPDIWPSLGVAYMSTIAAVAWGASRDRRRAADLAKPLLVAKGVSTALFAYQYARTRRMSFLLSAILDAGLLAATAGLSSRAHAVWRRGALRNLREAV